MSKKKLKKVYICHPLTTNGDIPSNLQSNMNICQEYAKGGKCIPISPLLAFSDIFTPQGCQEFVMECCQALLLSCDEAHFHGEWERSKGCIMEMKWAIEAGMKVVANGRRIEREYYEEDLNDDRP